MTLLKKTPPRKERKIHHTFWAVLFFSLAILILWLWQNPSTFVRGALTPVTIVSQITGQRLQSTDGRTNVLLLGLDTRPNKAITGSGLTDTVIVASFSEKTKDAALLSLPRDLWSGAAGYKINALYSVGGIELIRSTLERMLDLPLHYYAVVDFATFERGVDLLGGVEVDVTMDLIDNYYPVAGRENDTCGITLPLEATSSSEYDFPCRFEQLHFKAGRQKMDGEMALKYVRSRHATGDEGTDFARAQRQQQVMESLAKKGLSWENLLNPTKMKEIFDSFRAGVETNIGFWEAERFYNLGKDFDLKKIRTAVLSTDNALVHPEPAPESDYQWILAPQGGDFASVALFVQRLLFGEGGTPL